MVNYSNNINKMINPLSS